MKLSGWLVILVVIHSDLFAQTNGDFPSGAHQAVRCMLAHNSPQDCTSLPKVTVPSYLLQEYHGGPSSLHEALHEHTLVQLSEDQVADIPLSLLYLIPRARLADLKVYQLKAILQKHGGDTSLVHQVAACLHHGDEMLKFTRKMDFSLPEESLQILAESVEITDLTGDFLILPFIEKEPLLAYLRPAVLFNAETSILYTIFNVLKLSESNTPKKSAFYFLTETAIRHRIPLSKLRSFVLGLSSDQLLNESLSFDHVVSDFRLDLSILQARALFERTYQNTTLSSSHFIDSKPLLYKLSPELLQKFPQNVQKYDVNYIEPTASIPLPTACQITEYVIADCILTRRFPKNKNEFWDIHIRHLGKWVYTLPLSALEGYKTAVLSTAVLRTLESPALSPLQAYYLSGKGEVLDVMAPSSVLELETFLHALPASQLVNRKIGEIIFHVKLHLVSKLPANNLARTLSLVNKIASSIGDPADVATDDNPGDSSVLEELLGNKDVNQILTLLSPKDLALSAEAILKFFAENRIRNSFGETIEQLPQQILAALMDHDHDRLKNASQWRWSRFLESSQVSHLLVGGLTCKHIEDMDTGLFIPIMSRYNAIRKKSFPKNLQYCCLQKLINHLKLKMTLTQTDPDLGLISLLEPIEIESIGGYVLVNIPIDAMQVSPYLGLILSKIGLLSSAELMLSADISRMKLVAELAVDKEGNVNIFLVRNLVWFLPPNATTPDLRLMLEARLLDTTVCQPTVDRRHIATRLISVLGSPEHWSAGVLTALQDLLIVFSDEELSKISQSSWTKAADSFTSHYDDLVDWTQPSAFYKVCSKILGKSEEKDYKNAIGRYMRWRLKASQWLLDTVVPIPQPDVTKQSSLYTHDKLVNQDKESKTPLGVFDPQVEMEPASEENDESEYDDIEENEETTVVDITISTDESTTKKSSTIEESSTTKKSTTEKSTTEESTTEKSTTEKSTTNEKTTTEQSTTNEKITTEKSTTNEKNLTDKNIPEGSSTKRDSPTEKSHIYQSSTTKKSTTEKSTTEESTTEKSTTEKSTTNEKTTTEQSTTNEKITTEKSTTNEKNLTDKNIPEGSSTKRDSPTEKSHIYQNLSEDNVTQNGTQENSSTKKMFWETGRNLTEASITGQLNEGKVLILNSTTQQPTILNISSTSIKHYISRGNNVTGKINESLYENTTDFKNLPSCINLVNKEDCQNDTSDSPNKPSNKMSVNEITHSSNETSSRVYQKTTLPVFHKTSNVSFGNQPKNYSFQNTSLTPSKISPNQSEDKITADRGISTVTPLATKSQHDKSSEMPLPSHKPYNKLSAAESSSNNNTSTIQSPKKNYTFDENSQNNFDDYTNITKPEHHFPTEDHASEEEDEETSTYDTSEQDVFGIPTNASRRKERSVFDESSDIKLSCNAIKMVGSLAELTLTVLDLNAMSATDIADCRMEFGEMELSEAVQKIIWKRIENEMKLDGIHLLGRLLRVMSVADLWDINFRATNPWVLETIHSIIRYNSNTMVMKKLMQEVVKYNAELSVDLLAVLGPTVCSLEPHSLRALSVIGLDLGPSCPSCLPYLALRATEELGSVNTWTLHFVHSLQAIVAGLDLDNWKELAASHHKPLTGLQPSAAKCLNASHLEVLSPDQIRVIPVATLLSLSEHQMAAFNLTQLEAVKNITRPSITEKMNPTKRVHISGFPRGFSNQILPTILLITFISILNLLKSL